MAGWCNPGTANFKAVELQAELPARGLVRVVIALK